MAQPQRAFVSFPVVGLVVRQPWRTASPVGCWCSSASEPSFLPLKDNNPNIAKNGILAPSATLKRPRASSPPSPSSPSSSSSSSLSTMLQPRPSFPTFPSTSRTLRLRRLVLPLHFITALWPFASSPFAAAAAAAATNNSEAEISNVLENIESLSNQKLLMTEPASATAKAAVDATLNNIDAPAAAAASTVSSASVSWISKAETILAFVDFGLVILTTILVIWLAVINFELRENERKSIAEMKARIAQFGGEESVEPDDLIFATEPPADKSKKWKMKPFVNVDTLKDTHFAKPIVVESAGSSSPSARGRGGKSGKLTSSSSSSASKEDMEDMNRMSRRIAAKEQRKLEKEEVRKAALKASRSSKSKTPGKNTEATK